MNCKDCIYWGKEDRPDGYNACYRLWDDALFITEEVPFETNIPPNRVPRRAFLTKAEFGCIQFEPKRRSDLLDQAVAKAPEGAVSVSLYSAQGTLIETREVPKA